MLGLGICGQSEIDSTINAVSVKTCLLEELIENKFRPCNKSDAVSRVQMMQVANDVQTHESSLDFINVFVGGHPGL